MYCSSVNNHHKFYLFGTYLFPTVSRTVLPVLGQQDAVYLVCLIELGLIPLPFYFHKWISTLSPNYKRRGKHLMGHFWHGD